MIQTIPLYHLELVRDRSIPFRSVARIEQCAEILHELLDRSPVEQMIVMYVDPMLGLVGVEKVGLGSVTSVHITMAELFRGAITASVSNIILGHNHPSDDPTPSGPDWDLTDRARILGAQLGINVLDHIIVTPTGKHVSMKEEDIRQYDINVAGRMMNIFDSLSPEKRKVVEDRMRVLGLDPNTLPREKDIQLMTKTSLTKILQSQLTES